MTALAGVEFQSLVSEPDALTTRPPPCASVFLSITEQKLGSSLELKCCSDAVSCIKLYKTQWSITSDGPYFCFFMFYCFTSVTVGIPFFQISKASTDWKQDFTFTTQLFDM